MSENQPLVKTETGGDHSPQAHASANVGVGMFLAIAAFGLSCLAVGGIILFAILMPQLIDAKVDKVNVTLDLNSNRAQISENHWRNLEVQQNSDHAEIEKLKQETSHARRR